MEMQVCGVGSECWGLAPMGPGVPEGVDRVSEE